MDYSQLSDFEINKLVAYALGNADVGRPFDEKSGTACRFTVFKNSGLNREGEIVMHPMTVTKDFCNNPTDAWPIIVDNEISLNSYSGTWEASYEYDAPIGAFGTDETVTSGYEHRNPLRAAMIAFLMKQEHANA
jgi:hypothetical protein